ncbi:MAG TPA: cytochrome ubiquinol oxidase subunit I [Lacipirellulaceae bacterium]|nr:cytochrome ubiquinol oxidase subunit I [Lacipirellulaceae bacterium]
MLSRIQFALTIMFHYLFPPLTIGLGIVLVYLEAMYLRTRDPLYETAAKFWTKIFGLNFAMGVVTGIVMEFEFGTNWAVYSRYVGDVFGSALAAEGIFAFFLESGFLALLLFGWNAVGPKMHFFATLMVAIGGIFSSVWITIANSWQQTPAGYVIRDHMINGNKFPRAEIIDFWAMVFNPSSVNRLVHVWLGAFILGAFFVMSISAWYLLKGRHTEFARRSFTGGLALATVCSLAQLFSGHFQAAGVGKNQPAKLAAMEGIFVSETHAPMHLFGWPDDKEGKVLYSLKIPGLLSFLMYGTTAGEVAGFDKLEPTWGRPPVWITFQSYHLMIAIGVLFIISTLYATYLRLRGTLFDRRWLLWYFVFAVLLAFAANESGWVTAEVGRQPWIVYPAVHNGQLVGGLRTNRAVSEAITAGQVLGSIIMFSVIYLLLFVLWIILLNNKIQQGPEPVAVAVSPSTESVLSAASKLADHEASLTEAKQTQG